MLEPIVGLHDVAPSRYKLKCRADGCDRRDGVCIQCSHRRCGLAFHPICAVRAGLCHVSVLC